MDKKGKLVLFSGPSGVGKDTVLDVLIEKDMSLQKSISLTTRPRRDGEVEGVDYYFTSTENFKDLIAHNGILEYAQYGKNLYGTPKEPVDRWLAAGKTVILKIEVQGASQIKKLYPDAISIFLMPPSMEELEERLRRRGTEREDDLNERLEIAKSEIAKSKDYDHIVINESIDETADTVLNLLKAE